VLIGWPLLHKGMLGARLLWLRDAAHGKCFQPREDAATDGWSPHLERSAARRCQGRVSRGAAQIFQQLARLISRTATHGLGGPKLALIPLRPLLVDVPSIGRLDLHPIV
jgi:hypothetical protein